MTCTVGLVNKINVSVPHGMEDVWLMWRVCWIGCAVECGVVTIVLQQQQQNNRNVTVYSPVKSPTKAGKRMCSPPKNARGLTDRESSESQGLVGNHGNNTHANHTPLNQWCCHDNTTNTLQAIFAKQHITIHILLNLTRYVLRVTGIKHLTYRSDRHITQDISS